MKIKGRITNAKYRNGVKQNSGEPWECVDYYLVEVDAQQHRSEFPFTLFNAKMRDYSQGNARQNVEDTEDVAEEGEEEKPVQNASKVQKVAIDMAGYVKVTDKEYDSLRDRFGKDLPEMVEILSAYKESTGKKYRSDAGALRGWVRREFDERKRKQGAKSFKQMERERDASVVGSMLTEEQRRQYGI